MELDRQIQHELEVIAALTVADGFNAAGSTFVEISKNKIKARKESRDALQPSNIQKKKPCAGIELLDEKVAKAQAVIEETQLRIA